MTDNEIIKALEYCFTNDFGKTNCNKCAFYTATAKCMDDMQNAVIDLINRQKSEIERLKKENAKQKAIIEAIDNEMMPLPFETDFDKAIKQAKSEAIKEFAEQLKKRFYLLSGRCVVDVPQINNLVKVMTE